MTAPRLARHLGSVQRIHGLVLACDAHLPGIMEAACEAPDVEISIVGELDPTTAPARVRYRSAAGPDGLPTAEIVHDARGLTCFRYRDGTGFDVDTDTRPVRITAVIAPSQTLEDMSAYLYGPVLGFVLRELGRLALHASSVAIDDRVALFAGAHGAGKSTIAALLAARGHDVLCDDLTSITRDAERLTAHRAFDHVRLWPSSETVVFGRTGVLSRITPGWDKRRLPLLRSEVAAHSMPIGAIYVLDSGTEHGTESFAEMRGGSALLALVTVTYCNYLLDAPARATEMQQLSDLLARVPVVRLPLSAARAMAPAALCEAVERDMASRGVAVGDSH